ncbi:BMP family ABC transporter substrate-binding protein [Erysipelothrix sp. HDW6C]|uniref:BMP family lipoprotein n=1 Tax=Erysipelothrix sp. HDW6C TaxID=2714930 RepID=UPI00140ABEE8|nr:BMP family ABC transporter substrate-binding protein [Erysipelothrix sp. HDW6C]QIK70197.1 BMP family ABC transporter substrate-binding protein [Erysipelothrix sp. HDW6C]
MKKLGKSLVLLFLAMTLVACSNKPAEEKPAGGDGKFGENSLYLITDVGTIDDRSFNQGSWEGMKQYADEIGVKPVYLQPAEKSTQAYFTEIETAINAGAKVVVTPGFLFENAVHQAQALHPDVKFVLVDGEPRAEGDNQPADFKDNTVGIKYHEEQAGFLAGYAAVKEGFTKLGFMGGMQVPAVVNFGYGYVKGADFAAKELGVQIEMRYTYLNDFSANPQWETQAGAWYNDGIEVIFAAAGGAGNSVMASAAKSEGKWVIGVDVDQKDESPTVITSSMKNLKRSVYEAVKAADDGDFPGGKMQLLSINEDMVQLSDDFSRFKNFTQADYEAIVTKLKADADGMTSSIPNLETVADVTAMEVTNTKITEIK